MPVFRAAAGQNVTTSELDKLATLRDEDLLLMIQRSDAQALMVLYDRYGRLVYSIALRIIGDPSSAEEVAQDVFQIVWQSAGGFRAGMGSPGGWLVGITRHRAIDEIRSRRHKAREREVTTGWEPVEIGDTSDLAQQVALRSDVEAALTHLPDPQRQAIEMAYFGGLTCNEIAMSLGTSSGTVKTRLRLGLVKLRAILLPGWQEGDDAQPP